MQMGLVKPGVANLLHTMPLFYERRHIIRALFVLFYVHENAHAPDDSRIRPKEARCENRTVRHGSRQVSFQVGL
ncbi:hypothetical protein M0802_015761 [Mischocyttarus mexicanus]|nr:hypothetical protein M0802_015761 [Mischocyttarus mexicanus]